jgi:hypothetical protein
MLLKSRASPDMLPFTLRNKKRLAIRHMNRSALSNDTIDSVLRHREICRSKDLPAPPSYLPSFFVFVICRCKITKNSISKRAYLFQTQLLLCYSFMAACYCCLVTVSHHVYISSSRCVQMWQRTEYASLFLLAFLIRSLQRSQIPIIETYLLEC